jgi:imidazolonepropionase-like amidohydrolase
MGAEFTGAGLTGAIVGGLHGLTALRAAWLFDGLSATLVPDPLVVLDGTSILEVSTGGSAPVGTPVIELAGATLLPGLVDTHVHLAFDASADPIGRLAQRSDDEVTESMVRAGQTALRGGVTTVRDLGDRGYLSLELRGREGLPTILAAGPPITTPGGHCHFLGGATPPTAEGMRVAVQDHVARGVDVIKIMASGGGLTQGSRQDTVQFSPGALHAAVAEAHRLGLRVTAHAHATGAIAGAVAAGVDGLEHVSFWTMDGVDAPADLMRLIVSQRIAVGATVGMLPVPGAAPPPPVAARLPGIIANIQRLYEDGAVVVAGSDAGIAPVKPHDVIRFAPALLRHAGMAPADALRAVTSTAAEVCGVGQRKGRIAAGYDADILAVDGDPITDPAALHRIRAVYARGAAVPGAGTLTRPAPAWAGQPTSTPVGPVAWSKSAASGAGARIRQASVTSSASRLVSTSASRSITSGQPSYPGVVKKRSGSPRSSACFSASSPTYSTAMSVRMARGLPGLRSG